MISVLVPLRPGDPARDRLWEWVQARWRAETAGWELIWASDGLEGPWRKGVALQNAYRRSQGSILVVTDADVWIPGVFEAVRRVAEGEPWVRSHSRVCRLTSEATDRVLGGEFLELVGGYDEALCEPPYVQSAAGAGTVMRRDVFETVPMDCRFAGWGGEDSAWADALRTLYGSAERVNGRCFHLWHPPAPRIAPRIGSDASNQLRIRYKQAFRSPERTKVLIEEGRRAYYQLSGLDSEMT